MTMRIAVAGALMAMATTVTAQTAVGNPPGGTLAPATGNVAAGAASPGPAQPGDLVVKVIPAPAKTSAETVAAKYQTEVVCKTTVETGSLIARHKTCLTRKQWQYVNDENEREARKMVEDNNRIATGH